MPLSVYPAKDISSWEWQNRKGLHDAVRPEWRPNHRRLAGEAVSGGLQELAVERADIKGNQVVSPTPRGKVICRDRGFYAIWKPS